MACLIGDNQSTIIGEFVRWGLPSSLPWYLSSQPLASTLLCGLCMPKENSRWWDIYTMYFVQFTQNWQNLSWWYFSHLYFIHKKRTILTSKFMLIYFLKMIYKNFLISTSERKSRHCYKLTICFVMILCLRFFVSRCIFLLHRTH